MQQFYARACGAGAELVVFPEMSVCGYPAADLWEKDSFLQRSEAALAEVAALTADGAAGILCGAAARSRANRTDGEGKLARNIAVLCDAGRVVFTQTKRLLPFYDVFDEQRYF